MKRMKHFFGLITMMVWLLMLGCENHLDNIKLEVKKSPSTRTPPSFKGAVFTVFVPLWSDWNLSGSQCDVTASGTTYNFLCPSNKFKSTGFHSEVGCVAVAMGQVMYYWKKPLSYNWSIMKDSCPTSETARLLYDVGLSVHMMYNYPNSNGAEGAVYSDSLFLIPKAFKNTFGFSSAKFGAWNFDTLITELNHNRPVIINADNGFNGHSWVVNGYGLDSLGNYHLYSNWGLSYGSWDLLGSWPWEDHKRMVWKILP